MFQVYKRVQNNLVEAIALASDTLPPSDSRGEFATGSTVTIWPTGDAGTNRPSFIKIYDNAANTWRILYQY